MRELEHIEEEIRLERKEIDEEHDLAEKQIMKQIADIKKIRFQLNKELKKVEDLYDMRKSNIDYHKS